jgi:hypothetical protein
MADDASELFKVLDENKDGGISPDEFNKAYGSGIIAEGPAAKGGQPGITRVPTETAVKLAESALNAALAVQEGTLTQAEATAMVSDSAVASASSSQKAPGEEVSSNANFQQAFAAAQRRLDAAREAYARLQADGQLLQKENAELKQVVAKARVNAERRVLKKRAENVQLLADNAELERFTAEAKILAEQKAKMASSSSVEGNEEWELLQKKNTAIRRKLEGVLSRPQRLALGGTMESPKSNISSLEATPRIDAALEWRSNAASDPASSSGMT